MHLPRMMLAAACVAATAGVALAQEGQRRPRVRDYDFSIGAANLGSATTNFDGGTVVRSESTTGLGFNFDYHFADRWSAGAEVAMHRVDFVADIAVAGSILGAPGEIVDGKLDSSTLIGHIKRRFGDWEKVTPYATVGLGLASIDTNIPQGPPVGTCWFDPWWGLICDSFQPTRTTTDLAKNVGVGVRWDFGRRLFLDASVGRQWIDFDNAHRPDFSTFRVAIGFR